MIEVGLHVVTLLALPPLLIGVIAKTKAAFAGRVGPSVLQPYYDIVKLLRKGLVLSSTTTWIFVASPVVTLVAVALAGLLAPLGHHRAPIEFTGDLVLFAYLLGLARFFTTAAALDTGSSFEGMGASREVTFACISEPALLFAFLSLARITGSLSLSGILAGPLTGLFGAAGAAIVLVSAGLFVVLLAENCRIPVDDPNTHLELTMIHEVMVLDHGGPLLGMILYGAAMKLLILGSVLVHVVAPYATGSFALDGAIFVAEVLGLAVIVGVVESVMARLRMRHVPHLLIAACLLSGFGFVLLVR
jgi:formate hydrogenlyase subunit 4